MAVEKHEDEELGGFAAVADQIAQEGIEDVRIERQRSHSAIVAVTIALVTANLPSKTCAASSLAAL